MFRRTRAGNGAGGGGGEVDMLTALLICLRLALLIPDPAERAQLVERYRQRIRELGGDA